MPLPYCNFITASSFMKSRIYNHLNVVKWFVCYLDALNYNFVMVPKTCDKTKLRTFSIVFQLQELRLQIKFHCLVSQLLLHHHVVPWCDSCLIALEITDDLKHGFWIHMSHFKCKVLLISKTEEEYNLLVTVFVENTTVMKSNRPIAENIQKTLSKKWIALFLSRKKLFSSTWCVEALEKLPMLSLLVKQADISF